MSLIAVPITFAEACAFLVKHHRHHKPPVSHLFSVACADIGAHSELEPLLVGVAIVGRPVARMSQNGWTAEVTRLATDGTRNACSFLYASAWRAARALGYLRLVTYTLPEEGGASLRAAGFRCLGERGGGSWSRKERPRVDCHPTQVKFGWEVTAND